MNQILNFRVMKVLTSKILKCVCDYFELQPNQLKVYDRRKRFNHARQIYYYLSCEVYGHTQESTAFEVKRDRIAVSHGCAKIRSQKDIYPEIKNTIFSIRIKIDAIGLVINDIDLLQLSINYTNSFIGA